MKEVYTVWMEGVYMQRIFGVYLTKEEALENAKIFIAEERDDYHTFKVSETPIGKKHNNHHSVIYEIVRKDKTEGMYEEIVISSNIEVILKD